MNGGFHFTVEQNSDGHTVCLNTENTMREFVEMTLMFLLYLGNHDEDLVVELLQAYDANMHDTSAELFPLTAPLQA